MDCVMSKRKIWLIVVVLTAIVAVAYVGLPKYAQWLNEVTAPPTDLQPKRSEGW
jgi:hypothetical protein